MSDGESLTGRDDSSLGLTLSGGGLRATFFELGILLYLALANKLQKVRGVVSVSGGSILAAHLAINWERAKGGPKGFNEVASELVQFARRDIRNRALVRWMWWHTPLITFFLPSFRKIHFLRKEYEELYKGKTLQDLPLSDDFPTFAFVTTEPKQKHRIAFTRDNVWRIKFNGDPVADRILAKGTPISLAVAASSCFPPVFSRLRVTNKDLRITWDEFGGKLTLTDGGVSGNLGVEVFLCLVQKKAIQAGRLLACDAEQAALDEPSDNFLTIINTMGTALSESARQLIVTFAPGSKHLPLASRGLEEFDLRTGVVTDLSGYRTDLDKPTWQECYALIVHGAAIAQHQLGVEFGNPATAEDIRKAVREILNGAGCPVVLADPADEALKRCNRLRFWGIGFHVVLILLMYSIASECLGAFVSGYFPRPYFYLAKRFIPESVVDRDIDCLLDTLARAACVDSKANRDGRTKNHGTQIESLRSKLEGSLSRLEITVGNGSSESTIYVVDERRPPECEQKMQCRVTFRGTFPGRLHQANAKIVVTGRIVKVIGGNATAYIDAEDCRAESAVLNRYGK